MAPQHGGIRCGSCKTLSRQRADSKGLRNIARMNTRSVSETSPSEISGHDSSTRTANCSRMAPRHGGARCSSCKTLLRQWANSKGLRKQARIQTRSASHHGSGLSNPTTPKMLAS
eukprot:6199138-Pleurochrysis_carterae.AAC.1